MQLSCKGCLQMTLPSCLTPYAACLPAWLPIFRNPALAVACRPPRQAYKLQKQGWTLVDVRLATDFDRVSAQGSLNVPMYRCVVWGGAAVVMRTPSRGHSEGAK